MPTAVDYILEGLAQALDLERACGQRTVEIDAAFLRSLTGTSPKTVKPAAPAPKPMAAPAPKPPVAAAPSPKPLPPRAAVPPKPVPPPPAIAADGALPFVFLHDKALTPAGVEMMAKIVLAMKATPETAPIVFTGELPPARVYIVLGSLALRKWFPGQRGAPGQWLRVGAGQDVLVTYSPNYILRFPTVTESVMAIKKSMWKSLQSVMLRVSGT